MNILEDDNEPEVILNEIDKTINTNRLYKTSFCKNMEKDGKCDRLNCDFYHSVEERRIPMCLYNDKCINVNCKLCHSNENEYEWLKRTGIIYPDNVPLKYEKQDTETGETKPEGKLIDKSLYIDSKTIKNNPYKEEIYLKCDKEMAAIYARLALERKHKIIRIDII